MGQDTENISVCKPVGTLLQERYSGVAEIGFLRQVLVVLENFSSISY